MVLWALLGLAFYSSLYSDLGEVAQWDPWDILGVTPCTLDQNDEINVCNSTVKKAFKKLSLKFHPDKPNADLTPEAQSDRFIEISKAYKVLSHWDAYSQWIEHGHPDGKQAFTLVYALPAWLVGQRSSTITLLIYALMFGVALPLAVAKWWQGAKTHSKNTIITETMAAFYAELKEDVAFKAILDIISRAAEFIEIFELKADPAFKRAVSIVKPGDWSALVKGVREEMEVLKIADRSVALSKKSDVPSRVSLILTAHMLRVKPPANLRLLTELVVETSLKLTMGLLQIAVGRNWMNATSNILQFSQYLVQAVYLHQSPLLQMPHLTAEHIAKHFNTKKRQIKDMEDFCALSDEEQQELLKSLTAQQSAEAIKWSQTIPQPMLLNHEYAVLGETCVIPQSLITLSVKLTTYLGREPSMDAFDLTIEPMPETKFLPSAPGSIRSAVTSFLPATKKKSEQWWVGLANAQVGRLICIQKCQIVPGSTETVRLQFQAPPNPGSWVFQLVIKSDSYVGMDTYVDAPITVNPLEASLVTVQEDEISEPEELPGYPRKSDKKQVERGEFDDSDDSEDEADPHAGHDHSGHGH